MKKSSLSIFLFCLMNILISLAVTLPLQADTSPIPTQQKETKILGSVETLGLPSAGLALDARIDTGAELSSLDARNIKEFKKDQQCWVSFDLIDRKTGSKKQLSLPVDRHVQIKRHGAESQNRPVICLPVTIGRQKQSTAFTLTDRQKFEYPVLIGRNFLTGQLVDISKSNLAGKPMLEI